MNFTRHPNYWDATDMLKWRLAYEGGRRFITSYLKQYSSREDAQDFAQRKCITYVPHFARADLDEVKDAIFQRMPDISRTGGNSTYREAIAGLNGGVDREGNSMASFIGQCALGELLVMGKVGCFVDMPREVGLTKMDAVQRPYLYLYQREQIENWIPHPDCPGEYQAVQLVDEIETINEETGFPEGYEQRRRLLKQVPGGVEITLCDPAGEKVDDTVTLPLAKIPFVVFDIKHSLMSAMADYQIALMNLASSDLMFILKANFPFYVEKINARTAWGGARRDPESDGEPPPQDIKVGVTHGRLYSGDEKPGFIHPSSEPLKASMEKQEQMKVEMRQLLKLKIAQTTSTRVSKESKEIDERTLENGLSAIGMELERGERQLGEIWADYVSDVPPTIHYPTNYSLKTDSERRQEANELSDQKKAVPSVTFAKLLEKQIAKTLMGHKTSAEEMEAIYKEIDDAPGIFCDPELLVKLVDGLVCDPDTASRLLGFADGTAAKALDADLLRANKILEQQVALQPAPVPGAVNPAARGVKSLDPNRQSGKDEKTGKPKRGVGK